MRWSSLVLVVLVLALGACGNDVDTTCASSGLTYQTFGAAFVTSWCRGCHSIELPQGQRQHAPPNINFDSLPEVRAQALRIYERTSVLRDMPPEGGPSDDERAFLAEWLSCGAP